MDYWIAGLTDYSKSKSYAKNTIWEKFGMPILKFFLKSSIYVFFEFKPNNPAIHKSINSPQACDHGLCYFFLSSLNSHSFGIGCLSIPGPEIRRSGTIPSQMVLRRIPGWFNLSTASVR